MKGVVRDVTLLVCETDGRTGTGVVSRTHRFAPRLRQVVGAEHVALNNDRGRLGAFKRHARAMVNCTGRNIRRRLVDVSQDHTIGRTEHRGVFLQDDQFATAETGSGRARGCRFRNA